MVLRTIALVSVLLLTCLSLSFTVQAQTPVAAISVVCNEMMEIDVQTGSSHSSNVTCEVENPTAYVEKIEITIDSGSSLILRLAQCTLLLVHQKPLMSGYKLIKVLPYNLEQLSSTCRLRK